MLSAVSAESPVTDHLQNYLHARGPRPVDVRGRPAQARKPNKPGESIPPADAKIAASSQTPGKRSNQVIPYARVSFQEFERSSAHPSGIFSGDIVLLHKTRSCIGHGSNRPTKVATWRQINAALLSNGRVGESVLTGTMYPKVMAARRRELGSLVLRRKQHLQSMAHLARRPNAAAARDGDLAAVLELDRLILQLDALMQASAESEANSTMLMPLYDWSALSMVTDWTPDGVLLSKDSNEDGQSDFHAGGGESGTVLNIAIQGVCSLRNSAQSAFDRPSGVGVDQVVDPDAWTMDYVYLLLVAVEVEAPEGSWTMKFVPSSGRIISLLSTRISQDPGRMGLEDGYPNSHCISHKDVACTVAVWRVARIMDTKETVGKHAAMRVNVSICALDMQVARLTFGEGLGMLHDPDPEGFAVDNPLSDERIQELVAAAGLEV